MMCLAVSTQYRRVPMTDGQTSCHFIVRAYAQYRAARNIILVPNQAFSLLRGTAIHIHSQEDATTLFHNADVITWCKVTICALLFYYGLPYSIWQAVL